MVDLRAYAMLRAASGAFACKCISLPQTWTPTTRPHAALILPSGEGVDRLYLTTPKGGDDELSLECFDLNELPDGSLVEVRYDAVKYVYYRRDGYAWLKVGEAHMPFLLEVFSMGRVQEIIDLDLDD